MAARINLPNFTSDKSYERYKQELLAWKEITDIKTEKLGIAVALSLPDNIAGIREKVFDELEIETLKKENGFDAIISFLDKHLGKDDLADCLDKFEDFEDCEKGLGESMNDFILRFDQKYNKIVKKKMTLPSEILAFKLLRKSRITKDQRMLVMTGMDYTQRSELYEQAKSSLKKFLGQQPGGSERAQQSGSAVKLEPVAMASSEEMTMYATGQRGDNRPRFRRNFRQFRGNSGRSNSRASFANRGFGRKLRNMNPTGADGNILTCLSCGSYRHMIARCPDSWENMSSGSQGSYVATTDNYVYSEQLEQNHGDTEQAVLFTGNSEPHIMQLGMESRNCAVLDCGCSSTVCGRSWMTCYLDSLSDEDRRSVRQKPGVKLFKFGGGERLKSVGSFEVPAYLGRRKVTIVTDVVESDIPLLLSLDSMKKAEVKLDLVNDVAYVYGEPITLNLTSSGHYCLPILQELPIESVNVVSLQSVSGDDRKKTLTKLHRQFAHPSEHKLKMLLKDANVWQESFEEDLRQIYDCCQICKRFTKTPPRPVVALPMARQFNETVAMDLKKWKNTWILHMVDMWSRMTVSVFIDRKTPSEIIDKIMVHWVGAGFGIMDSILTDNGGEFSSAETREVASILNIKVATTAANSPFQNGLCERIHSVTDSMLLKLEEQCPNTPLSVLLCWANMSRNALQMWHGFSSYQLVFGQNPKLPNIMTDRLPALEGITSCETFAQHLNTLHAARKAFVESEACERLRRALRSKIRVSEHVYEKGDQVYYKRDGHERWLGPGKVVFQDGKVIFVRHGGSFVRVSPNRLIPVEKETENMSRVYQQEVPSLEMKCRGDEFDDRGILDINTECVSEDLQADTNSNVLELNDVAKSNVQLVKNDRIQFRENVSEDWNNAIVIGRAGKATGRNKNWYNVTTDGGEIMSIDLGVSEWRRKEEMVNIVLVPKCRHTEAQCVSAKTEELNKLQEFQTYEEVNDEGQNRISTRWVLCEKGDKVKARLVARGFEEEDDFRRDSPTIDKSALRLFLAITASLGWRVKTTDIKSAFLQGRRLDRDVYITPPVEANVLQGTLWKLKQCLYGLNDAARQFFQSVAEELTRLGCVQSKLDPALFFWKQSEQLCGLIACHIDDFLHAGEGAFDDQIVKQLTLRFLAGKRDQGHFRYIGFDIEQIEEGIIVNQSEYVSDIDVVKLSPQRSQKKQESLTANESTTLRGLVGRLNWAVQGSRPDMSFEMTELSTKLNNGTVADLLRGIKAIRKLKEGISQIFYPRLGKCTSWKLVVFTDAAHANLSDGVSSMGAHVVLLLGESNKCCPLTWHAGKIRRVVRSTIAAEALSLQQGLESALYLRKLLDELLNLHVSVEAIIDNRSVVEALHSTKMVDDKRLRLDIASIKELLKSGEVAKVRWCSGEYQIANCMTKKGASSFQLMSVFQSGEMLQGVM